MKVLGIEWFTNALGCIGIARVETEHEGILYFISAAPGKDEEMDIALVRDYGARFPNHVGDVLFGVKS